MKLKLSKEVERLVEKHLEERPCHYMIDNEVHDYTHKILLRHSIHKILEAQICHDIDLVADCHYGFQAQKALSEQILPDEPVWCEHWKWVNDKWIDPITADVYETVCSPLSPYKFCHKCGKERPS